MNIGFDLDKVFINTPPFIPKTLIDKLYKKKDNEILLYRIPGRTEQIIRSISHMPVLRAGMKENLRFLKSLPKNTNKLYLISSRFKFLENKTRRLIEKHHFDKIFDEMYFNFANEQPHLFKNRIIKNLKLDYYIDDDLSLLNYVAKHNPKTIFFWLTPKKTHNPRQQNISPLFPLSEFINRIKSPSHNLQSEVLNSK